MVNSYNYFESSKVKVFPSAFRGTTGETGSSTIDIEARLNTEANFTKRNGALTALKDSYLIDWSGNKIKCVISGYYFEIDAEGVTLKEENKNYYLKIWPVETALDSGENKTRVLGLANNIVGNLDSEGKFKGLGYIEKPSTESYTEANSLCISKNNAVNYMALLPKEVLHGDEEHSIKIDGSLTDLTVDGDTTIGEGLVITEAKTGDVKKQIIVGQYNNKKNDNCIFEVGSGTSDSDRSDILQVTKDTVSVTNSGLLSTSNITTDVKVKSRTTDGDNKDGGHLVFAAGAASGIGDVTVGNYNGGFRAYCYKDGTVSNDNYRSLYFTKEGTLKQAIGSTVKEIINNKGEATDITGIVNKDNGENANIKFTIGDKVFSKTVKNVSHATTADSATSADHATSADSATNATTAESCTGNAATATNATTAENATNDSDGNKISTTYATKDELSAAKLYVHSLDMTFDTGLDATITVRCIVFKASAEKITKCADIPGGMYTCSGRLIGGPGVITNLIDMIGINDAEDLVDVFCLQPSKSTFRGTKISLNYEDLHSISDTVLGTYA